MTEYQLRFLLYDLYCNNAKLRQLSKDGIVTSKDIWEWQDEMVKEAKKDNLLVD